MTEDKVQAVYEMKSGRLVKKTDDMPIKIEISLGREEVIVAGPAERLSQSLSPHGIKDDLSLVRGTLR